MARYVVRVTIEYPLVVSDNPDELAEAYPGARTPEEALMVERRLMEDESYLHEALSFVPWVLKDLTYIPTEE